MSVHPVHGNENHHPALTPGSHGRHKGPDDVDHDRQRGDGVNKIDRAHPLKNQNDDGTTGKTRGVIRLLEAGHFRGVADVRLRINFFDELSTRASQEAASIANAEAGTIIDAVNEQLELLLGGFAVDEHMQVGIDEALGGFQTAVDGAVREFASNNDLIALKQSIQSSFESLVAELRELLAPPGGQGEEKPELAPPEAPGVPVVPGVPDVPVEAGETTPQQDSSAAVVAAVEPQDPQPGALQEAAEPRLGLADTPSVQQEVGDTPEVTGDGGTAPVGDPFAALTAAFEGALATFLTALESAPLLPDPAPAHGKGKAYDKFLAMYNALRGSPPDVDEIG